MQVFGVTSDKFGESEAKEILRQCDEYAVKVQRKNPAIMNYPSDVVYMQS
jgi:hypothetical protein